MDSTHVKVCANSKKMRKRVAHEQALWYEEELQKQITNDREAHGKKPLYDEAYDCYLCPENKILSYRTTNRDGYKEYQNCEALCANCPSIHKCTESKRHEKVVMRHVWEEYMEMAENIRHTLGNKAIYELR